MMRTNESYRLGTQDNFTLLEELGDSLLTFGKGFPAPGGGAGWLDNHGTIDPTHGVHTWITSRMAHSYALGSFVHFPDSDTLIDAALDGLRGPLHDDTNGGWYPSIQADGTPESGKVCYAHAFVILAATSALLAGRPRAQDLLTEALATYDAHFWDDEVGLAVDTWDTTFTTLDSYRGINANMHTTEAFLAVADATGDESYRTRAGRIIDHVVAWASANKWRIPEHFSPDWEPLLEFNADKPDDQFKPYGATPGHGIEWSRLIAQYAVSSGRPDNEAAGLVAAAESLFARAITDGWNVDGAEGIVYTTDWDGKPVVHDRMHWTIAEAMNTAAVLHAITGNDEYADWYERFLRYADQYVVDHKYGSWFHQLNEHNEVIETVWPGKSDVYHALQSTLIPLLDPSLSVASALKRKAWLKK